MGGVVDAVDDVFDSVVETVKDTVDMVANATVNLAKGDFKAAWDDWRNDVKEIGGDFGDMLRSQWDLMGEINAAPFDMVGLDSVGDFTRNVYSGIGNNLALMVEGVAEGKWSKFRDGFLGTLTTVIYIIAGVIGVLTGNWWLTAAAIVALDGQHNNGALTKDTVELLGKIETAITGTTYLEKYAAEIAAVLIVAASLYAGYYGGQAILKFANIGSLNTLLNYYSITTSVYGIYDNLQAFEEFRIYYKGLLDEYLKWAEQLQQAYAQSKAQWFELYANLENQEVCYEAMAGGYLYNAGAGSDEYSVSTIHEPSAYMLVLDTRRDMELDRTIFFNSEVDYTDLRLEYVKEPVTKWI